MSETPTVPPFVNSAMKLLLPSPAHWLVSKSIVLISFIGRKSGKIYTTPVCYSQRGDEVIIFTHANWWINLRGGKPVTLRLRGQVLHGWAEPVVDDAQTIAARLTDHLRKVPSDATYYSVTFDNHGNPKAEEVLKAAQNVVMICVRLEITSVIPN